MTRIDTTKIDTRVLEFDGIYTWDAPDYCDAHITYAEYKDGTELTDDEIELLNEDADFVHEELYNHLY
jgi:hypothetical protein